MGCDIHTMAEVRTANNPRWYAVTDTVFAQPYSSEPDPELDIYVNRHSAEPYGERNYALFGFLADVRNGSGFAGVDTGDPVTPIFPPRGVPEDASLDWIELVEEWGADLHSTSWATLAELQAADWDQRIVRRGVMGPKEYEDYRRTGTPSGWAGSIFGANMVTVREIDYEFALAAMPDIRINVACEWETTLRDSVGIFIEKTLPALAKLGPPDRVRMMYGFDN